MKHTTNFKRFQQAVKRVSLACSKDEVRPTLQTLQVITRPGLFRLQAADGFRAHREDISSPDAAGESELLLGPELIQSVLKYKTGRGADPRLTIDTVAGELYVDDKRLAGCDSSDTYPNIDAVYPTHRDIIVTVDAAPMLQALKTAYIFTREGSNIVKLHISDEIVINGSSEEWGESWNAVTPLELTRINRHDLVIGFNCSFLMDYFKACAGPVRVEFTRPTAPALFVDSNGFTMVIMPMVINDAHGRTMNLPCMTPAEIPAEDRYNAQGGYIYPDSYTARHPRPESLHPAGIPSWYIRPAAPEFKPRPPAFNHPFNDDMFVSHPEPGAVIYEIKTIWARNTDENGKGTKKITFELGNPTPDPLAPIPVTLPAPADVLA